MRVELFDFDLPEACIALRPVDPRDLARLLIVRPREAPVLSDHVVRDLPAFLSPGDALVFNDTKVIPAQLQGMRVRAGVDPLGVSATLHMRVAPDRWRAFARPARRIKPGDHIVFHGENASETAATLQGEVVAKGENGEIELAFSLSAARLDSAIAAIGHVPLPPYIASKRPDDARDRHDYQTIYARQDGAVAAPTAGLHFTPELFASLDAAGIERHFVTLHVGAGTFLPVKADDTDQHRMHSEIGHVRAATAQALNAVRARGNRIVAVGTTSLRLLESAADVEGRLHAWSGATDIFITPGYGFRAIDALMTNFHLPRSTLFMLVAAFSGLQTMHNAYAHAIRNGYRFYSYGDASLLFRADER